MKVMNDEEIKRWCAEAQDATYVEVEMKDLCCGDDSTYRTTIKMNTDIEEGNDDISYYCNDIEEFEELFDDESGEEQQIVKVYDCW